MCSLCQSSQPLSHAGWILTGSDLLVTHSLGWDKTEVVQFRQPIKWCIDALMHCSLDPFLGQSYLKGGGGHLGVGFRAETMYTPQHLHYTFSVKLCSQYLMYFTHSIRFTYSIFITNMCAHNICIHTVSFLLLCIHTISYQYVCTQYLYTVFTVSYVSLYLDTQYSFQLGCIIAICYVY